MKALLSLLVMITFSWSGLAAQESDAGALVSGWFREHAGAKQYELIRREITDIFEAAGAALVPAELLIDVLNEAAARGIPSPRIIPALKERLVDMIRLKNIIDKRQNCLRGEQNGGQDTQAALLKDVSLLQRRGIPFGVIETVLDASCASGKKSAAALSALRTLVNIPSLGELSDEQMTALVTAILQSSLSPAGYSALSPLYIKGKMKNMTSSEITEIIISVLREGKGLIRIEQELDRRRRP